MAEYVYLFNKDNVIIKPAKKSPLFLRMMALLFAMIFGVLICSIRLKQISNGTRIKFQSIQVMETPDTANNIKQLEVPGDYPTVMDHEPRPHGTKQLQIPLLHYPKPQTFSRAECAHNPVRFFAIVSMQRSGSGWFETLLNNHTNVSSNGEIFSVMDRRRNLSSIIKTLDKVYNLDWLSSASKNECSAAVGFKWMLNQGLMEYHREIEEYLNHKGVSVIFLFRRNLLRRLVSVLANSYDRYAKLLNGTHKSHVHSPEEAETLSSYKPTINSSSLITDLKEVELTAIKALEYFNSTRHIILYYEDLIKNHTKAQDVLEFLRLPRKELTSRQVKIHRGSLSEHIKNWNDVNRTLNGTVYENFLRADYKR